ncbi:MAG: hypothetical protein ABDH32_08080 [Candidatus Caldarchaeales archaeon]
MVSKRFKLDHGAESLNDVLGIGRKRYSKIVDDVLKTFDEEDYLSKAIEKVANKYSGRELVLALLTLGFAIGIEACELIDEEVYNGEEMMYIG